MPFKDAERRRIYIREYNRVWIAARRDAYFSGKCCALCGAVSQLELDHIDKSTKIDHRIWSWSDERRTNELAKCRVLCRVCHVARHAQEKRRSAPVGMAWCCAHKEFLPEDQFFHRSTRWNGLDTVCIECKAQHDTRKNHAKKTNLVV